MNEDDAISRQAALDEIISRLGISGEKYLLESERYIYQIIKDLPPVTPKQRWIPVSEGLPDERQSVLVWCPEYRNMYCAYLKNKNWWIFGAFSQIIPNAVIAWMPLPEPYKTESEEQK
jgi:hypothetical protein